jgi:hypothetical protein
MIVWLLMVAAFFVGVLVRWRSRGRWERGLRDFVNVHGD